MIGIRAILLDLFLFGAIGGIALWAPFQLKKERTGRAAIVALVFVVLAIGLLLQLASRFGGYLRLRRLTAESVEIITIGETVITDRNHLAALEQCFNEARWFSFYYGGKAVPVPLTIKERTGAVRHWSASLYLRENGAIVEFGDAGANAMLNRGQAFVQCLPDRLREMKITLPSLAAGEPGR